MIKNSLYIFFSLFYLLPLNAQEIINIRNPSFEGYGIQGCCTSPLSWYSNPKVKFSSPDIQPGYFGVELPPKDGENYLSLVAREDATWEMTSQRLSKKMIADGHYWFSMAFAKSDNLISRTINNEEASFDKPLILKIWGGSNHLHKDELLFQSSPNDHEGWKTIETILKPAKNHLFIIFEVAYTSEEIVPYNGNLLLDHCSPIIPLTKQNVIIKARQSRDFTSDLKVDKRYSKSGVIKNTLKKNGILKELKNDFKNIKPVLWSASISDRSYEYQPITWKANITKGWKLYAQGNSKTKGLKNLTFNYPKSGLRVKRDRKELGLSKTGFDKFYKKDLKYFTKEAEFIQAVRLDSNSRVPLFGTVKYTISKKGKPIVRTMEFMILQKSGKIVLGEPF